MADLRDLYSKKLECPMFWIISKVVKVIPLTSQEGEEIFDKVRYVDFVKEDIINHLKEFKDDRIVGELEQRLDFLESQS